MPVKPSKQLKISGKQLKGLQKRIKERKLQDSDYELLQGLAETVECLSQALAEKDTSIGRLCIGSEAGGWPPAQRMRGAPAPERSAARTSAAFRPL